MYHEKYITKKDLYELSEQEMIGRMKNCKDTHLSNRFDQFMKCNNFVDCEQYKEDKFCVNRKVKRRYINPMTTQGRIYDVSGEAKEKIDNYVNLKISNYAYVDLN